MRRKSIVIKKKKKQPPSSLSDSDTVSAENVWIQPLNNPSLLLFALCRLQAASRSRLVLLLCAYLSTLIVCHYQTEQVRPLSALKALHAVMTRW